jgi:hypothetical protein
MTVAWRLGGRDSVVLGAFLPSALANQLPSNGGNPGQLGQPGLVNRCNIPLLLLFEQ